MIETIITAVEARDMIGYTLEGHVEECSTAFDCTPPTVGVIMAALAGELSPLARGVLLQTLWFVSGCDAGPEEECRRQVQEGFWRLLEIGLTGDADDAETVADICESMALGGAKSAFYQAELRERVRARTKRRSRSV
ncbi:hypothetical protein [Streptomyces sp. NPDC090025]|uniref:hypothetical protein n=1 Tax=Streptomyces sp. NPDC090025 TaxID=3365922 RepID=UPI003833880D